MLQQKHETDTVIDDSSSHHLSATPTGRSDRVTRCSTHTRTYIGCLTESTVGVVRGCFRRIYSGRQST